MFYHPEIHVIEDAAHTTPDAEPILIGSPEDFKRARELSIAAGSRVNVLVYPREKR